MRIEDEQMLVPGHRRPVPYALASKFCPELPPGETFYLVVAVMAMGWHSACGFLQHIHRKLFSHFHSEAGLTRTERSAAMHRYQAF